MLGAVGAMCCLTAGTALGVYLKDRRQARLNTLTATCDALAGMRLMLLQERLKMSELLTQSATYMPSNAKQVAQRFTVAGEWLEHSPLVGVLGAYEKACDEVPIPWEQAPEKEALQTLFSQLGTGTAAMREQAVATCIRRLKPIADVARDKAQTGGRLCMQLGMLVGLMVGIALW